MIRDPSLVFYADLAKHDGAIFMSDDMYGRACDVSSATWSGNRGVYFPVGGGQITSTMPTKLLGNSPFTVVVEIEPESDPTPDAYGVIVFFGQELANKAWLLTIDSSGALVAGWYGVGVSVGSVTREVRTNLTVVYDGVSVQSVYKNGVRTDYGIGAAVPNVTAGNFKLGYITGLSRRYNGYERKVGVYSRTLTPQEVLHNYISARGK